MYPPRYVLLIYPVQYSLLFALQSQLNLYALDPVGTYGLLQTPSEFFGFKSKLFAGAADLARVVLMCGERRIGFLPNVYKDESPHLEQVR